MPSLALRTDFSDFYDAWFQFPHEPHQYCLERLSNGGRSKRQQFVLFDDLGLDTPVHGLVRAVVEQLRDRVDPLLLVVYLDEQAHRGEGKVVLTSYQALADYPDHYCSAWVASTSGTGSISYRLLQIGCRAWWLRYDNPNGWLSNHGELVEVKLLHEAVGFWEGSERQTILKHYPLFAIDFVAPHPQGRSLAIDFNMSPGLKGTGIEELLKPKAVYELLLEWVVLNDVCKVEQSP